MLNRICLVLLSVLMSGCWDVGTITHEKPTQYEDGRYIDDHALMMCQFNFWYVGYIPEGADEVLSVRLYTGCGADYTTNGLDGIDYKIRIRTLLHEDWCDEGLPLEVHAIPVFNEEGRVTHNLEPMNYCFSSWTEPHLVEAPAECEFYCGE